MKKKAFVLLLLIVTAHPAWAAALDQDGHTTMPPLERSGYVFVRGLGNLIGFPFEIPGSMVREHRTHNYVWPVTWIPRFVIHGMVRISSIVNDVAVQPFVAPFTDRER